jgi:hypothetical protein
LRRYSWLFAALSLIASPMYSQNLNTISAWNGSQSVSSFGVDNTATYGQTITIASSTTLNSFAFQIGNCNASVTFRGEVYAWSDANARATGAALTETASQTLAAGSGFHLVTFNTGGVALSPGKYVLFASTSRDQSGAPISACQFGIVPDTTYGGGSFVYINNGPDPSQWTASAWSTSWGGDLAFQTTTDAAPTQTVPAASPLSLALLALGLAAATGILLRKRTAIHGPAS